MRVSLGRRRARRPALALTMHRLRRALQRTPGAFRKLPTRKNPAWILHGDQWHYPVSFKTTVKALEYGELRRALAYQSRALGDSAEWHQSMQAGSHVAIPFFWHGMRNLVLPRTDMLRDAWESDWGAMDLDEFVELWFRGPALAYEDRIVFPFDLEGYLYLPPTGTGIIFGIYCWALAKTNIDEHPDLQMVLHTLLNALRWEGVIVPSTRLTWGLWSARSVEQVWYELYGGTGEPSEEWGEYAQRAGLSEEAYASGYAEPEELSLLDRDRIEEYELEMSDWFELILPDAGEYLQVTAAGPYSCPVDYCPVPGMPGYMPHAVEGGPAPRALPSSGEQMTMFGGKEHLQPPPVPVHPEVRHGPPAFAPTGEIYRLAEMAGPVGEWGVTQGEVSRERRRTMRQARQLPSDAAMISRSMQEAQDHLLHGPMDSAFESAAYFLPIPNLRWVMDKVSQERYDRLNEILAWRTGRRGG